jgi:hypothetical protein
MGRQGGGTADIAFGPAQDVMRRQAVNCGPGNRREFTDR